jgi:hypothetical protein
MMRSDERRQCRAVDERGGSGWHRCICSEGHLGKHESGDGVQWTDEPAAEPLTPHMTRIRELEALVDWLRDKPSITARMNSLYVHLPYDLTIDEIVVIKEGFGVELKEQYGNMYELSRKFGDIEFWMHIDKKLCGKQQSSFVLDPRLIPSAPHVTFTAGDGSRASKALEREMASYPKDDDEPDAPFGDDEKAGMTMGELTARRDEIVAEVTAPDREWLCRICDAPVSESESYCSEHRPTAPDRFYDQPGVRKAMGEPIVASGPLSAEEYDARWAGTVLDRRLIEPPPVADGGEHQNAPADSPARQPRHPDIVMGGGLVVPGNHPLMAMLTAAVEADKADKVVTASQEMNAVVDAIEKPRAQRTLAEEAILADIFGL